MENDHAPAVPPAPSGPPDSVVLPPPPRKNRLWEFNVVIVALLVAFVVGLAAFEPKDATKKDKVFEYQYTISLLTISLFLALASLVFGAAPVTKMIGEEVWVKKTVVGVRVFFLFGSSAAFGWAYFVWFGRVMLPGVKWACGAICFGVCFVFLFLKSLRSCIEEDRRRWGIFVDSLNGCWTRMWEGVSGVLEVVWSGLKATGRGVKNGVAKVTEALGTLWSRAKGAIPCLRRNAGSGTSGGGAEDIELTEMNQRA